MVTFGSLRQQIHTGRTMDAIGIQFELEATHYIEIGQAPAVPEGSSVLLDKLLSVEEIVLRYCGVGNEVDFIDEQSHARYLVLSGLLLELVEGYRMNTVPKLFVPGESCGLVSGDAIQVSYISIFSQSLGIGQLLHDFWLGSQGEHHRHASRYELIDYTKHRKHTK